jgi:putative transposase
MRTWFLRGLCKSLRPALSALLVLVAAASAVFKSRSTLQLENLALRHQLTVLRRSVKRPKLSSADRLLWTWICRVWSDWRSALVIVKPETVIAWHRKGFRLFWTWKVRRGQPGRPAVPKDVQELIRKMSRENPLWGAPRIHGELLKLGIDLGETSVGKYLVRRRKPPSQTWRTFLENHVKTMVSIDFFTVPTIRFQVLLRVWFEAGGILVSVQVCGHDQTGSSAGGANEFEHLVVVVERLGRPVLGDFGK